MKKIQIETPYFKNEKNLININFIFNDNQFDFSIFMINDDKIKFILSNQDIINYKEYKKELTLASFKNMNKYFIKFDSLNELENDLISKVKEKNIIIESDLKNNNSINLSIISKNDNIINIKLDKVEIKEKEKTKILYYFVNNLKKDLEEKDKKIQELENKILLLNKDNENFKKDIIERLNEKDKKIELLEKDFNSFKKLFDDYKQEQERQKSLINNTLENPDNNISNNELSIISYENILVQSSIFEDADEIIMLLSNIGNNKNNFKLIFDSKKDGENEEKFIKAYTEKNDLVFLIKTNKLRRFGGYANESFQKDKFKKTDKNAFLFNLNKKKIYKSKGNERSIWRGSNNLDSINFGNGVDLKIFHSFFKKQSRAHQGNSDYDYNNEIYALNGDESFNISSLEIYQAFSDL